MNLVFKDRVTGEIIRIPADGQTPYRRLETWDEVGTEPSPGDRAVDDMLTKMANALGVSVDVVITKAAAALGIEKCPVCQIRGQILRRMGELGWYETLRRLRETFRAQ